MVLTEEQKTLNSGFPQRRLEKRSVDEEEQRVALPTRVNESPKAIKDQRRRTTTVKEEEEVDIDMKAAAATKTVLKVPKGTRDFSGETMEMREKAFEIVRKVFKRRGATALDTPTFELKDILTQKYGEESKLIYDLADQDGELCSLRYDLTVPFARYVSMNGFDNFRRYQIGKVYRRDNPSVTQGRFREFYQCDYDVACRSENFKMGTDFEVVKVLIELLDELGIGDYEIKFNERKLLDLMLEICGVPPEKFRTVCSSVDKLDKVSFQDVKREMVEEKGLSEETADKIGIFVKERGSPLELVSKFKQEDNKFVLENFVLNEDQVRRKKEILDELEILFGYLKKCRCIDKMVLDLSLARGLDYYTGIIFEAVFKGDAQVGSIAAGGRYDNLIGMLGNKKVGAVGLSLGIERVFSIMEQLQKNQNQTIRATKCQVLVGIMGIELGDVIDLINELWSANVRTEFKASNRIRTLITFASKSEIPCLVIVGERELKAGTVTLQNVETKVQEDIPRSQLIQQVQRLLNI